MISQCPHSWLLHLYHVLHLNDFLSIFHPHSYTHFKGLSVLTYSAQYFNIYRHMFPTYLQLDTTSFPRKKSLEKTL